MTDDYYFEYKCPICHDELLTTIAYDQESEPNQYGRENLRKHLIEKHGEELVLKYLTEKYAYKVADELTKEIRSQHYRKSKKKFFSKYLGT